MILRRFMQHVKEQNWFAVGLDVLVVIVGIFLGLQVQDWNESRKDRIEELNYLSRLTKELDVTISNNISIIERGKDASNELRASIEMIDSRSLNETNKQQFEINFLTGTSSFPRAVIGDSVITEMVSTGKIPFILSNDIRSEIISYYISIASVRENNELHFEQFLNLRSSINQHINLSLDYLVDGKILDEPNSILDNRMLLGDMKFMNELNSVQIEKVKKILSETQDLRGSINLYLSTRKNIAAKIDFSP